MLHCFVIKLYRDDHVHFFDKRAYLWLRFLCLKNIGKTMRPWTRLSPNSEIGSFENSLMIFFWTRSGPPLRVCRPTMQCTLYNARWHALQPRTHGNWWSSRWIQSWNTASHRQKIGLPLILKVTHEIIVILLLLSITNELVQVLVWLK